jgi:hypothetical protein
VAPLAELDPDSVSLSVSSVAPLSGLDPTGLGLDVPALATPLALEPQLVEPSIVEPSMIEPPAPVAPASAATPAPPADGDAFGLPLLDEPPAAPSAPAGEAPSARPKPRMTKADLSSLPLLADFGLEDAEPAAAAAPAAPPAAEPPAAAPRASKATPTFVTETMAALYVKQGLLPEAIGVYRQLVEASPADAGLRAKLAELERMLAQQGAPKPAPDVEMPEFEPSPDVTEPASVPANAALAAVSFGGIGLQGQGTPTPIVTPAVPAGPTAREFFATFARRAAVAVGVAAAAVASPEVRDASAASASAETPLSTPVVDAEPATAVTVAPSGWPLDALFGAAGDVRDLHAAEVLAGVGTFTGPDGGTGVEALFAETGASTARRSVPRASEMLKFDQFFQKPGTGAVEAPPAAGAPGDDDLGQFQDWLKGLKK